MEPIALGRGTQDEVLAFVNGQGRAYVAINSPRRLNQGIMAQESFRAGLQPRPRAGRWDRWRVAEYEMRMRGIKVHRTPHQPENAPGWMKIGFAIYESLHDSGFEGLSNALLDADTGENSPGQVVMETYPHAAFTVLHKHIPFGKTTLEGRIQRQLVLYVNNVDVPNPMQVFEEITRFRLLNSELVLDDLLEPTDLDAAVAAFTAWSAAKREVTLFGHPEEGQVVVPVGSLQARYD